MYISYKIRLKTQNQSYDCKVNMYIVDSTTGACYNAHGVRGCLGVWLLLLFKVFFTQKSMSIIFFYFLKIIFKISTSK